MTIRATVSLKTKPTRCARHYVFSVTALTNVTPNQGTPEQKAKLENSFKRKIGYHEKIGGHIWNGEL